MQYELIRLQCSIILEPSYTVTQMNVPCLNPSQIGWYSIYLP